MLSCQIELKLGNAKIEHVCLSSVLCASFKTQLHQEGPKIQQRSDVFLIFLCTPNLNSLLDVNLVYDKRVQRFINGLSALATN